MKKEELKALLDGLAVKQRTAATAMRSSVLNSNNLSNQQNEYRYNRNNANHRTRYCG